VNTFWPLFRQPAGKLGLSRDEVDKLAADIAAERLDMALTRWSAAPPGSLLQRLGALPLVLDQQRRELLAAPKLADASQAQLSSRLAGLASQLKTALQPIRDHLADWRRSLDLSLEHTTHAGTIARAADRSRPCPCSRETSRHGCHVPHRRMERHAKTIAVTN
jgi:hypothetical protein